MARQLPGFSQHFCGGKSHIITDVKVEKEREGREENNDVNTFEECRGCRESSGYFNTHMFCLLLKFEDPVKL